MATIPHSPQYTPLTGDMPNLPYLYPPQRGQVTQDWIDMMRSQNAPVPEAAPQGFFNTLRARIGQGGGERGAISFGQTTGQPAPVTRAGQVIATRNAPRVIPGYEPTNYGPGMTMDEFRAMQARLNAPRSVGLSSQGQVPATIAEPNFRMQGQVPATIPEPNFDLAGRGLVPADLGPNWRPGIPNPSVSSAPPVTPQAAQSELAQGALGGGRAAPLELGPGPALSTELVPTGLGGAGEAAAAAAPAAEGVGRLAGLGNSLKSALLSKDALGAYLGNGPLAAGKVALGRLGAGSAAAILPNIEGQAVAKLGPLLGPDLAPGSYEAAAGAGSDVGTGALLGTMVMPGIGTGVGAALGGVKALAPVSEEFLGQLTGNGTDTQWGRVTDNFNKIITKRGTVEKVGQAGATYLNQNYYGPAKQIKKAAEAGKISHEDAIAKFQTLNAAMKTDIKTLVNQRKTAAGNTKSKTALAIQMADAMNKYGQQYIEHGDAGAQYMRDMGAQLQGVDPALANLANSFAGQRSNNARSMADSFAASQLITPQISQMDRQLADYAQKIQQLQALQNTGASGGTSATADIQKAAKG